MLKLLKRFRQESRQAWFRLRRDAVSIRVVPKKWMGCVMLKCLLNLRFLPDTPQPAGYINNVELSRAFDGDSGWHDVVWRGDAILDGYTHS
jgi:hypothetical protein